MNTNDFDHVIDHLANKLSVPAKELTSVLIRQAGIEFLIMLAASIFFVLLVLGSVSYIRKTMKHEETTYIEESVCMLLIIMCIAGALLVISIAIPKMITAYFNPEYWALQALGIGR